LTATKAGRGLLRSRGTFPVLRELHGWEEDPEVLSACENVIQVLIGDEPEAGMENLLQVRIPEGLERRLRSRERRERPEERPEAAGGGRGTA
ncbi:HGH1 protein, partial [Atrichornis clamosus]|nr:HGH1 protein [Atrichornis clamosus]